MQVYSVRFTNADQDEVEVSSDLGDFYLPWPCHTWHRQAILSWLDRDNKVRSYREDKDPELLRQSLTREVYGHAARLLDSLTLQYAVAEQIIWPDLEREARGFLLDGTVGPLMRAELEGKTRSEEELAYAIIHRANQLNRFRGAVIAARASHVGQIKKNEYEDLEDYDTGKGWPSIPRD